MVFYHKQKKCQKCKELKKYNERASGLLVKFMHEECHSKSNSYVNKLSRFGK